jgi:calcium-dependent protein kinase
MLAMDEKKRLTAEQVLQSKWVTSLAGGRDKPLSKNLPDRFRSFRAQNMMKKIALTAIAQQLPESQIEDLKNTFLQLDENGDGTLTLDEIKKGAQKHNVKLPPDFDAIFAQMDSDGSGAIDYTEFIAASLDKRHYIQEDVCWAAFRVFDLDGNGKITRDELSKVLHGDGADKVAGVLGREKEEIEAIIKDADTDGDGEIDFDEFMAMMRKG